MLAGYTQRSIRRKLLPYLRAFTRELGIGVAKNQEALRVGRNTWHLQGGSTAADTEAAADKSVIGRCAPYLCGLVFRSVRKARD